MMKVAVLLIGIIIGLAGWAEAATQGDWARNTEADLKEYRVYACQPKGCVPAKGVITATVTQTAAGVRPTWILPVGLEGSFAVTAVDTSINESGLSLAVPFDTKAPAIPSDVQTN